MSKKYSIPAFIAMVLIIISSSNNPPNGNTGAPGDGLCTSCHSGGGSGQDGTITVSGIPSVITPNTAYPITITDSNPNGLAGKGGFQMTVLNSMNQMGGTLSTTDPNATVQTAGGRQYLEHDPAQNFPVSNIITWTGTWTAPMGPTNTTLTYYAAGNIANGTGTQSGDLIVLAVGSGMLMGGGTSLAVSITNSNDVLCADGSNGSATATATGGQMPYTYNWSNGASGPTAINLSAGLYTVTVTDNANATASTSVVISEPPPINITTPVVNHVSCNGGNNGSITASATGGVLPYSYNWSNGGSGPTISNLVAGSYTVTVTDDNGCTETLVRMITQPPAIIIALVNLDHESCAGADDGAIQISASGGVPPLFAEWSNGSVGLSISDLAPGVYSVTVTDNNDCTKTATYTINPGGTVVINLLQIQHVTCFGGTNGAISVNATGGSSPYTYVWSNGMTGASIAGLAAGNYLVTVTDNNGCSVVNGFMVNQPTSITVTINQTSQNLCFGDATADLTASASGGTPGYTYNWSNGTSGANNSNLAAGTYTLTVTDMNGCTKTSSAVVITPPQLVVNVTTTNETSSGANNGTATANVTGGTSPHTYLWNTGAIAATITQLPPGTYCVTVTDMNGCSTTACGQVNAFGCTMDVQLGQDLVICEGTTADISASVSGASGTVTYLWSNGSMNSSIQITEAGNYCVTVTDASNCQDFDCINIIVFTPPEFTCPVTNESSPGANDGAINCDSVPGLSYLWSNGATTPAISGLSPGQYCVTVSAMNGCTQEACFNVQPGNCQMNVVASLTNASCAGEAGGMISLTVNGGTAPISFMWSNGESTATISNLVAGDYSVTISDAMGCTSNATYSISEPPPLVITIDSVRPISDFELGFIQITVAGGIPPYTYLWTGPEGTTYTTEDIDELQDMGYYEVIVTDAAGCDLEIDSIFVDIDLAVDPTPGFRTLKVYPVPTEDMLFVEMENAIKEALIIGVDGRLCKRILDPSSNKLEVGDLESGWYILRISDGENWYIARMVK